MKGLDLRKFKKVSEDKHSTCLKHPDGHEITIAHSKLKGDLKRQLAELPAYAKGGNVVKDAEDTDEISYTNKPDKGHGAIIFKSEGGTILGSEPAPTEEIDVAQQYQEAKDLYATKHPELTKLGELMGAPKGEVGNDLIGAQGAIGTAEEPEAAFNNPNINTPNETPATMPGQNPMQQAMNQQIGGIQQEAATQGALGRQQADILASQAQQQQRIAQDFERDSKHVLADFEHITNDMKAGHIDPERYQNSKSELGKVSSAIGLILGGLGGGMAGQENPALKFLNQQIDRDVDAQKADMANKNNILHALHMQYGNMKDATNMARAIYADQTANKIQEAAARSTDPLAKARAQQAIGEIKARFTPGIMQTAHNQAMLAGAEKGNISPAKLVPALVPQHHQEAVYKELERAENTRKAAGEILKAFDTAGAQWKMKGVDRSGQKAFEALMGPTFADIEGTVRQAAMDNAFHNMKPMPGDTDEDLRMKRQTVEHYLQSKSAAPRSESYGIKLPPVVNHFKKRQ